MKYTVWWLRLIFAAWMIPAGLNHFIPLFPQPMGNQPLSHEVIVALIDSGLFNLVKAVELVAGIAVLVDCWVPLALLICMPVSFCVFYWDAPLEGWGSRAALFGGSTLLCNVLLCLAYLRNYESMFALRAQPSISATMRQAMLAGRILFGAWLLVSGLNHFLQWWPAPAGQEPLAAQLLAAFSHSGMLDVAMTIQLVAGALILAGLFIPVALCVAMPVTTCMLYWALILERQPLTGLITLAAFAANGMLMLAYLQHYQGALQARALARGEAPEATTFGTVFTRPGGRISRGQFIPALLALLAAVAFYALIVTGRTAMWCILVLMIPALVLHAQRLRNMGRSSWLLLIPALPLATAFLPWLRLTSAPLHAAVPAVAFALCAGFVLWACIGREKAAATGFTSQPFGDIPAAR